MKKKFHSLIMFIHFITIPLLPFSAYSNSTPVCELLYHEEITFNSLEKEVKDYVEVQTTNERFEYIDTTLLGEKIQQLLTKVRTADDYIKTLRFIRSISSLEIIHKESSANSHGYIRENTTFNHELLFSLKYTDLVSPLLKFRNNLKPNERQEVLTIIDNWLPDNSNLISEDNRSQVALVFEPIRIELEPTRIFDFLNNISYKQEFAREPHQASQFGRSMKTVIENLPTLIRAEAKSKILEIVYSEHTEHWEDENDKNQIRNREIVHRLLFNDDFKSAFQQLKNRNEISQNELIKIVDNYWSKACQFPQQYHRGNYSFKKMLDLAKVIQKSPLTPYIGNDYVLLYGSSINGKGNLETSDYDVHPGPKFLEKFSKNKLSRSYHLINIHPEHENYPHSDNRIISTEEAKEMSRRLVETEKEIAKLFGRPNYEPSKLMELVPVNPRYDVFFKTENIGYYNSILIKVTSSKIYFIFVDTFDSKNIYEIEVK